MKSLKNVLISIGLLLISGIGQTIAQDKIKVIKADIGFEYRINSKVLNETRRYLVSLPAEYSDSGSESDKKYPVVYVLDGDSHFQHATSALRHLEKYERAPASIVVGIPNAAGMRFRDLAQKHDLFLKFIEDELMPLINENYRTQNVNTLFGHSLAGAFTLYVMSENHNKFNNYIAASPHLLVNKGEIQFSLNSMFENGKLHNYRVYFSLADIKGDGISRVNEIERFVSFLNEKATKNLAWQYQTMADQAHMTTPYLTIYQGLSFVFRDFQFPMFTSFSEFETQGGMAMLTSFYKKRGDKYNLSTKIDPVAVGILAELLLDEGKPNKALKLLQELVAKNPSSMRANFDLARLYQDTGEKNLAMQSYKTALKLLKPDQKGFIPFIEEQIKELETED